MKNVFRPLLLGLTGTAILGCSLGGSLFMLTHSRAGDEPASHSLAVQLPSKLDSPAAVAFGYADVESQVIQLNPTQGGRVVEVYVKEDSEVKAGAPLFRIDDRHQQLIIQQAEADVRAAESLLSDAKKLPELREIKRAVLRKTIYALKYDLSASRHLLSRRQELERAGSGNKHDVDAAADQVSKIEATISAEEEKFRDFDLQDPQAQIIRAEADVAAKKAKLAQAKVALDDCTVRAPIDGKVLRLFVHVGEVLSGMQRQPAIQFCPSGPRIIRAEIEQEFASRVAVGQTASVQDDSTKGQTFTGKVVRMSDWFTQRRSIIQEPLQVNDVRTLECIIQLDEGQPLPRIGQRVRVSLKRAS